ncbi:QRFP-like peptide receptor [Glandiceps talaboti]
MTENVSYDEFSCQQEQVSRSLEWDKFDYEDLLEMLLRNCFNSTAEKTPLLPGNGRLSPDYELYLLSTDDIELSRTQQILLTFSFTVNIILSVVGNVLVILVLTCATRMWTDLTTYLINLAIADLTMAIFCMPFTFPTISLGRWIFGTVMCPAVVFLQQVSVCVSIYTLTAVGIDRYYAILQPMKKRMTKSRTKLVICLIWSVSLSLSIVQLVSVRAVQFDLNDPKYHNRREVVNEDNNGNTVIVTFCAEWFDEKTAAGYELFIFIITYIIPLSLLLYTYVNIAKRLWGRQLPGHMDKNRDIAHMKSKRKTIKMLVIIVFMFALCWLPIHAINLVIRFHPLLYEAEKTQNIMRIMQGCFLWLACANSFVNPIVYGFINENFRMQLSYLLHIEQGSHDEVGFPSSLHINTDPSEPSCSTAVTPVCVVDESELSAGEKTETYIADLPDKMGSRHANSHYTL